MVLHRPAGWYPRRGEIYLASFPGGKYRRGVVLSADALNEHFPEVCVVPFSSQPIAFALRVPLPAGGEGLDRNYWAKCEQVHTVDKRYLRYPPLGRLPPALLEKVEEAVRTALGL